MSRSVLICTILGLLAIFLVGPKPVLSQAGCEYTSYALPDSVVPPLQGEGYAFLWTFDGRGNCHDPDSLSFRINYSGLDGDPIGAGIHRGVVGANGEEVISLIDGPFTSGIEVTAYVPEELCWEIMTGAGSLYFTVETTVHPTGAVRGQVWVECWSPTIRSTWGRVRSAYR
jgi:hypothetical protein